MEKKDKGVGWSLFFRSLFSTGVLAGDLVLSYDISLDSLGLGTVNHSSSFSKGFKNFSGR